MFVFGYVVALVAVFTSLPYEIKAAALEANASDAAIVEPAGRVKRSLYPPNGFVAGQLTPVWLAYSDKKYNIHYKRLEDGIVQKAFEYYYGSRQRREAENQAQKKFVYLSVLLMLEYSYDHYPAHDKSAQEKWVFEKILYGLAYWNEVNNNLRPVRHPGVRIRVTGIVIAKNGLAYRYQSHSLISWKPFKYTYDQKIYYSLRKQMQEWNLATNNFFDPTTFNVVATLTDYNPLPGTTYSWSWRNDNCNGTNPNDSRFSALMVYDDRNYHSIKQAIGEVAHLMGRQYVGNSAAVDAQSLTHEDLEAIKRNLQKKSLEGNLNFKRYHCAPCWSQPNEGNPPGESVPMILPADLYNH